MTENNSLQQNCLQDEYPRIRQLALAQREKATILFGDEVGVRPDHHSGTALAVTGKTPIVNSTGAGFGLNPMSAVSAQGEFRFMTVKGRVGTPRFIEFLERLIHNAERIVFLL